MTSVPGLVFSNYPYVVIAAIIFVGLMVPLLILSEYVFLEPYVVSHLPKDSELGLSLIVVLSALSGLVMSMNVYRVRMIRDSSKKMGGGILGTVVGAAAGACSCGPVGFAIISTFGAVGATASSFVTNYEIPIRLAAIGILCITYWTTARSLKTECGI